MSDPEQEFFTQLLAQQKIAYEEYQYLLALKERADDLEDMLEGGNTEFSVPLPGTLAKTPGLAVVVGHTKKRPGAKGVAPIDAHEYSFNSDLAESIYDYCQKRGVRSEVFTRDGKGIAGAYKEAVVWGATFAVELHFNAFNRSANGTETLYDNENHRDAITWASHLQDRILKAVKLRDRGLKRVSKGGRGYRSLSAASIPIAIVELFFGDNPFDASVGVEKKSDIAEAIADAAASFTATAS
ncbi:N-acetylmuramoyl-L-alanine amidase [Cognatiyoonia sp. IB215446]|uniref:N-acetylmuramoyl-L-alanine amidase n=1 Tax=Cognatiyoonia sp. IB215446 TaxID=3097355 RepID=UPI002A0D6B31|nr:N-acetylmuramoyl-L-alanine amidase [Cognatiyoonia sp. IB215446]MDX8347378.1 N-acetylmuramoyl-L-alanine amidase [Cognatiyoonia sp. IB215446]